MRFNQLRRGAALLSLAAAAALAACHDEPTIQGPTAESLSVIVNSVDRTLTMVPILSNTEPTRTVGLGAQGSPTTIAVRGIRAVVPMGNYPFAVVVNLLTRQVEHNVALPQGSGATGVAFANDSIAVVANPGRNSVTPVNVLRGTAGAEIAVGEYPQAVVAYGGRLFVLNAHLDPDTFLPTQNGTITVLNAQGLGVLGTIELSGRNPISAVARAQTLYVLHAGEFGNNNGSLSEVDALGLEEVGHHTGFGNFPGTVAYSTTTQEVFVSVYGTGILVWNPFGRTFTNGLDNPLSPGGGGPVSALGFDIINQLHVLKPGNCTAPGRELRMSTKSAVDRTSPTGVCPINLDFVVLPLEGAE